MICSTFFFLLTAGKYAVAFLSGEDDGNKAKNVTFKSVVRETNKLPAQHSNIVSVIETQWKALAAVYTCFKKRHVHDR